MASSAWQSKLQEAQDLTNKGAKRELGKDYSIAFQCYVRAGELYLWLVRQAEGPSDTSQLKAAADRVLSRAHAIKKVIANVQSLPRRLLSEEEQARALSLGARIDLNNLPEWGPHCCYPATDAQMQPLPLLAPRQVEQSAQYMCCSELSAFSCGSLYHCDSPLQGRQIVQRVVTDCSFVAALEVAAAHDASWGTQLAHAPLHPKNDKGYPVWSPTSIYNVRLHFNGKDRCVGIDDRIPCYLDRTPMCAVGVQGGTLQVWPSLLEKAYISLRGGYNFKGSNSSVDLHALTGWIPEQIGFQHSDFQSEKTWQRIRAAYQKGHLLITAGTPRGTDKVQLPGQSPLIDTHSYAVIDVQEKDGDGWLTLMNPWETGAEREIIRMTWSEASARLDSLYLNWCPDLFQHRRTWHGIWRQDSQHSPTIQLTVKESCEVWLLLTRHTTTSLHNDSTVWISLHLSGSQQEQTLSQKGVYVDSTHILVRTQVKEGSWRVAASRQGGDKDGSFSLYAYSTCEFAWQDVPATAYPHSCPVEGQWTIRTAGGNSTQPTFLHNPQYLVTVTSKTNLAMTVETSKDIPTQVVLVWSRGKRVDQITRGDIVASSGTYKYGLAMAEAHQLKPGLYTAIVSTFERGQKGDFRLQMQSDQVLQCTEISAEGAGKFHQRIRHRWTADSAQGSPKHSQYFSNPAYEITVDRSSIFLFRLLVTSSPTLRPPINVAVFDKTTRREVVSSGPYADAVCGVAIDETRLQPGDYLVVVSTYEAGVMANFTLEMYSDRRIVYRNIAE